MAALFAFLHHVSAFTLFAALVVEFVMIRGTLTVESARKIQRADMIFGISAGVLLLIGLARVFYFERAPPTISTPGLSTPSCRCSCSSA